MLASITPVQPLCRSQTLLRTGVVGVLVRSSFLAALLLQTSAQILNHEVPPIITVEDDPCRAAVSRGAPLRNEECMEWCHLDGKGVMNGFTYEQACTMQYFSIESASLPYYSEFSGPSDCYRNLSIGYLNDMNDGRIDNSGWMFDIVGETYTTTEAYSCQSACQLKPNCRYFVYREWIKPPAPNCVLKLGPAFDTLMNATRPPSEERLQHYCDMNIMVDCKNGDIPCLQCGGIPRCMYELPGIVAGPRYCNDTLWAAESECAPFQPESTTVAPNSPGASTNSPGASTNRKPTYFILGAAGGFVAVGALAQLGLRRWRRRNDGGGDTTPLANGRAIDNDGRYPQDFDQVQSITAESYI